MQGSDCVNPFVALQNCIKANPDAFTKDILDEEKEPEEEKVQDYKIIPPSWSREPRPKNWDAKPPHHFQNNTT